MHGCFDKGISRVGLRQVLNGVHFTVLRSTRNSHKDRLRPAKAPKAAPAQLYPTLPNPPNTTCFYQLNSGPSQPNPTQLNTTQPSQLNPNRCLRLIRRRTHELSPCLPCFACVPTSSFQDREGCTIKPDLINEADARGHEHIVRWLRNVEGLQRQEILSDDK